MIEIRLALFMPFKISLSWSMIADKDGGSQDMRFTNYETEVRKLN